MTLDLFPPFCWPVWGGIFTTYVRNIKKYLLAALYNAPDTIGSYYTSLVSHDMYGGGDRR